MQSCMQSLYCHPSGLLLHGRLFWVYTVFPSQVWFLFRSCSAFVNILLFYFSNVRSSLGRILYYSSASVVSSNVKSITSLHRWYLKTRRVMTRRQVTHFVNNLRNLSSVSPGPIVVSSCWKRRQWDDRDGLAGAWRVRVLWFSFKSTVASRWWLAIQTESVHILATA